jgi:hypothetical protein
MSGVFAARSWRIDWLAIVTFALASLWVLGVGSLVALYIGRRSLRRTKAYPELRGRTMTWAGLTVAALGLAFTVLWIGLTLAS